MQVVGKVSSWIDADSETPALRRDSVAALRQELHWAAHLSLQACLLPPPPRPLQAANYARILLEVSTATAYCHTLGTDTLIPTLLFDPLEG